MKGVMIPVVSAGSNQLGASETCTAHVSCPSGAAGAAVGPSNPRMRTRARGSSQREGRGRGAGRVMSKPPSRREQSRSEAERNDERNPKCSRLCADGRRCQHVPRRFSRRQRKPSISFLVCRSPGQAATSSPPSEGGTGLGRPALSRPRIPRYVRSSRCAARDRKSTRLNSSHGYISYAVFCLKKKKTTKYTVWCRDSNYSTTA